jgi:hypothetical protein
MGRRERCAGDSAERSCRGRHQGACFCSPGQISRFPRVRWRPARIPPSGDAFFFGCAPYRDPALSAALSSAVHLLPSKSLIPQSRRICGQPAAQDTARWNPLASPSAWMRLANPLHQNSEPIPRSGNPPGQAECRPCLRPREQRASKGRFCGSAQLPMENEPSALVHFPIALAVIADLQEPVFRVVPLAAVGTGQIPAPSRTLAVVVFGHREGCATTAGHEVHLEALWVGLGHGQG